MAQKYAVEYIDARLSGETYQDLVDLSLAMCSSPQFTLSAPDYGLPTFAFAFVVTLLWFAQALRSGVWTYYEAAPKPRQTALAAALREHAPPEFSVWYERGIIDWQDEEKIQAVDAWIEANDDVANAWLRRLARDNREALLAIT